MNNSCYRFEKYTYTDGLFNDNIDATYIIHLEGNGRLEGIKKQIAEIHPTNIVYIVFNKGFKKCKKILFKDKISYDIIDTNINIFKHANDNNYNNILVLEDDFIFSDNIKNKNHINNINTFLFKKKGGDFIYQLGGRAFILFPAGNSTYLTLSLLGHANIFSKVSQNRLINDYYNGKIASYNHIAGLDSCILYQSIFLLNLYIYDIPLVYQTFPITDNQNEWYSNDALSKILKYLDLSYIKLTNLDKIPEPGFSGFYIIAKIVSLLLFIVIIYIIYKILFYLKLFKYISKLFKVYRFKG